MITGRLLTGAGQLVLAVTGVALVFVWFIHVLITYYSLADDLDVMVEPHISYVPLKAGALLFGIAWLWALVTSISLLREASANRKKALLEAEDKPPILGASPPPT